MKAYMYIVHKVSYNLVMMDKNTWTKGLQEIMLMVLENLKTYLGIIMIIIFFF